MSSPVTVSSLVGAESLGSDLVSLLSIGPPKATDEQYIPEDIKGNKLFALGDGDFDLCVNGTVFHTHKYLLKRFNVLKRLIEQQAAGHENEELSLEHGAIDFHNTFKILYASPIEGVPDFDSAALVSALRISTAYDYPALGTFVVKKLESTQLSTIERIKIAREFSFASWEAPAYEELCARDEPITEEEANVLGMSVFVEVAKIREKEQRRRGHEAQFQEKLDEADEQQEKFEKHQSSSGEQNSAPQVLDSALSSTTSKKKGKKFSKKAVETLAPDGDINGEKAVSSDEGARLVFKPSFVGLSKHPDEFGHYLTSTGALGYKIPDCQCRAPSGKHNSDRSVYYSLGASCRCTTSPCVADALAQLQAHQIAHATSITQLGSAIEGIQSGQVYSEHTRETGGQIIYDPTTLTTVRIDVRKWLSRYHNEQN